MKLKLKKLNVQTGRPVIFISDYTSTELGVRVGDRLSIYYGGKKIIAIVDILDGLLQPDEVALSDEVLVYLKIKYGEFLDVNPTSELKSTKFILKKFKGEKLSKEEIKEIIEDIVSNALTEAEIAYFVAGVYHNGMDDTETVHLIEAISGTGENIKWNSREVYDKHCVGGIPGNRTTPLVVSICAAAGLIMPKTSSRAITSAAGTADTMETVARVEFSTDELKKIVRQTGACLAWGGALGLAPADDKLIRVERLLNIDPESQLIASILAKKISVGSTKVLIDIPYGNGAKFTHSRAKKLKKRFLRIASYFDLKIRVVLTKGDQPIGNGIGPVLEMIDVLRVLKRQEPPKDLEDKAIYLSGEILEMSGKVKKGYGRDLAFKILDSGKAWEKFDEIITAQGKKNSILAPAQNRFLINSQKNGKILLIKNHSINNLARILGCPADKASGIYLHKHTGEIVERGEVLAELFAESKYKLNDAIRNLKTDNPFIIT